MAAISHAWYPTKDGVGGYHIILHWIRLYYIVLYYVISCYITYDDDDDDATDDDVLTTFWLRFDCVFGYVLKWYTLLDYEDNGGDD